MIEGPLTDDPLRARQDNPGSCSPREYSTWQELQRYWKAEEGRSKAIRQAPHDEEAAASIPRGKYPVLDEFEDLLESGARVAKEQRRWLIGIPIVFGMGTLFMLLFTGWTILQQAVFLGLPQEEVVLRLARSIQVKPRIEPFIIWGQLDSRRKHWTQGCACVRICV